MRRAPCSGREKFGSVREMNPVTHGENAGSEAGGGG